MSSVPARDDDLGWRSTTTWTWTAATTVVVALVCGTAYWTTPYDELHIRSLTLVAFVLAALPAVVVGGVRGLVASGVGELVLRARR